jgi:tetratricopeptide (TPR) repeat protein
MTRCAALLALILLATLSIAAAHEKPKTLIGKLEQAKFREHLSKGRKAEDKKDYTKAVAEFREALKILPDDAAALSELGYTLLLMADPKSAEEPTRRSIANATSPTVKGASLYNLGRIREALLDKPGAIAAYKESVRVRPHAGVLAHLKELDSLAAAELDPFLPKPMDGPYPSIDGYCKLVTAALTQLSEGQQCFCGKDEGGATAAKVQAPWLEAKVFLSGCSSDDGRFGDDRYNLAVRTKAGWFVAKDMAQDIYNQHCGANDDFKHSLEMRDAQVVWHFDFGSDCVGGDTEDVWTKSIVAVVGMGASGKPSATPAIVLKQNEVSQSGVGDDHPPAPKTLVDVSLDLKYTKDGLELAGKTKGMDATAASGVVGKHTLLFP